MPCCERVSTGSPIVRNGRALYLGSAALPGQWPSYGTSHVSDRLPDDPEVVLVTALSANACSAGANIRQALEFYLRPTGRTRRVCRRVAKANTVQPALVFRRSIFNQTAAPSAIRLSDPGTAKTIIPKTAFSHTFSAATQTRVVCTIFTKAINAAQVSRAAAVLAHTLSVVPQTWHICEAVPACSSSLGS
eukprot:scaffold239087_cov24-Tisochrysis_lutea.AAC.4